MSYFYINREEEEAEAKDLQEARDILASLAGFLFVFLVFLVSINILVFADKNGYIDKSKKDDARQLLVNITEGNVVSGYLSGDDSETREIEYIARNTVDGHLYESKLDGIKWIIFTGVSWGENEEWLSY